MNTFLLIMKILPWVLSVVGIGGSVLFGKNNKKLEKDNEEKKNTIRDLREQIREMAILEGEKKAIDEENKNINKNLDNMSDDELAINYAGKLPNVPKRRTRKK